MRKREILEFDIEDIIKELNDVGIRTVQREDGDTVGVHVVDEEGNEYVLGRDFNIFNNIDKFTDEFTIIHSSTGRHIYSQDPNNQTYTSVTELKTTEINANHISCIAA